MPDFYIDIGCVERNGATYMLVVILVKNSNIFLHADIDFEDESSSYICDTLIDGWI